MRDKILLSAIGFLAIIVLVQGVQMFFFKRKVNVLLEGQIDEFELLKKENIRETDSIEFLRKNKNDIIAEKEQLLYGDVEKSNKNNIYYEYIKENINSTDDADSLASQLTKRYSK